MRRALAFLTALLLASLADLGAAEPRPNILVIYTAGRIAGAHAPSTKVDIACRSSSVGRKS
jgi:hypothetical protein